ncbi:uncharacterized protein LOC103377748 isoform X2 [Cynoglossus semilaevis]|uniref:uncharacterized protein LOC103377748 isoform X2 n=1 Tax=Cynoglossus semilaevis TaxID=244447 RepID=UPI0004980D87|nr:uncharacterized protein LOC103377748 isoform X2 [Cynoglossus semilaevis]
MGLDVLLYWPNIIGYIRFLLVFAAWGTYDTPALFVLIYLVFIVLDGVDGWLARRLGQTSKFGAWLDVVVDNLGRGMLWGQLFKWGWLVSAVEWCVFVCNHSSRGDHWKSSFTSSPPLIQAIMANGFRSALGLWVVSGLHCLPLWLYLSHRGLLSHWLYLPVWIQAVGIVLLVAGRLLALLVEMWCIWIHVKHLCSEESEKKK